MASKTSFRSQFETTEKLSEFVTSVERTQFHIAKLHIEIERMLQTK